MFDNRTGHFLPTENNLLQLEVSKLQNFAVTHSMMINQKKTETQAKKEQSKRAGMFKCVEKYANEEMLKSLASGLSYSKIFFPPTHLC